MTETWKTAALFAADLPAASNYSRWHFADMADMPLYPLIPATAWNDSAWNDDDSFRGGSMRHAISLARSGWPVGAETARKLHEGVQAAMPERKRLAAYSVAGSVPSIPRAIAGNPMSMRRIVTKETAQRPIVTLVCDICVGAFFPASGMIAHAAAVAGIVDFLESAGFRCDVLTVARFRGRMSGEIAVRMKAPEQPLNLAVLAYGLGHPSFFRRHMFAILQADPEMKPLGDGLGTVDRLEPAPELGTFTIGAASTCGDGATAPARFRHILTELARQGCPGVPGGQDEAA